jgi:hypothetical protein
MAGIFDMQRRMACVQGMVYPPRARHSCTQLLHKPQLFVEGQVFQHKPQVQLSSASPRAAAMALAKRRAVANENHEMRSIVGRKCLLKDGPQLARLLVVNFVGVNFVWSATAPRSTATRQGQCFKLRYIVLVVESC